MKLSQYAEMNSKVKLGFSKILFEKTEEAGKKIAVLYLDKPIDLVEGSRSLKDEGTGNTERMKAFDVEVVRIHSDDWDQADIDVDDTTGAGTCETDLRLDISNKMDVWLKSTSFAGFAAGKARERRGERVASIFNKMKEHETKAKFKQGAAASTAEPVATGGN